MPEILDFDKFKVFMVLYKNHLKNYNTFLSFKIDRGMF